MSAFDIVEADMFDANAGSDKNQEVINTTKRKALEQAIVNNNISNDEVFNVLDKFGYEKLEDITIGDYMKIVNELKKIKG